MDLATAGRLASVADSQAVASLRAQRGDPAAARAVAGQFGTLLMQRLLQQGDGAALAMTGGTGGNIVNAMFTSTIAQAAMSGDRLGLADILFRSMMAKQAPAAAGADATARAAAPQPPATAPAALPEAGNGFPLSPYWQDHGMRPLGGRTAGTPIEPPGSPVAGLAIRPALAGGAAQGASSPVCPLPTEAAAPGGSAIAPSGAAPPDPMSRREADPAAEPAADIAGFARRIGPALERAAAQLGVSPRVLLAQAALESGWGRAVVGNNLFGIKADPSWPHARVSAMTHEIAEGRPAAERAFFRAYPSLDDAVADYVALIADSPRYRAALGAGDDARGYGAALVKGGYATDGDYAQKLAAVAASPVLAAALRDLNPGGPPTPAAG